MNSPTRFLASTTSRSIDNRTDNTSYEYGSADRPSQRYGSSLRPRRGRSLAPRSSESEIALATGRLLAGLFPDDDRSVAAAHRSRSEACYDYCIISRRVH
mgnify:CR=1 FL=1